MADDQSQRPYRASEPPVRSAAKQSGSDPLAELARLIGQTDPFGEYGRENARHVSPPQQSGAPQDWDSQPLGTPYTQPGSSVRPQSPAPRSTGSGYYSRSTPLEQPAAPSESYGSRNFGRQSFDDAQYPSAEDDQIEQDAEGYPSDQLAYNQDGYEHEAHPHSEDAYYDETPRPRRRFGIMAVVGVLALAIVGTAGAFGYRAFFGSSGSTQPPPVIKADTAPNKIVPATAAKDAPSSKLITDRMTEQGQSEKLVSREEQPIDKPQVATLPQGASQSSLGSGVVSSEPKKIRTIAIHPDQPLPDAMPPSPSPPSPAAVPPPPRPVATPAPQAQAQAPAPPNPAPRAAPPLARASADSATADAEDDQPAAQQRTPTRQAAPASANAPLSLNPNAAPARAPARPAPAAPAPTRTASVPPASASSAGGAGSFVQVSSQRSEAEAQAAFRGLQAKFPNQLGGRQPVVHKVDLGAKGTYYRAMVGPFATANEAVELCTSLKAAGGQCLVQKN